MALSLGPVRLSRLASGGGAGMAITPGIEATEETGQEIQTGGVEQESPVARQADLSYPRGDRPRPPVEIAVGPSFRLERPVLEKHEREPIALVVGPAAQDLRDRVARS